MKKVEKEINSVNEAVQQVHIELEDYLSKNKSFKSDLNKSIDSIKQSSLNQQGIKSVLDGMLLLSACQSEFIQMQSYLDAVALKQRSAIVDRINELSSRKLIHFDQHNGGNMSISDMSVSASLKPVLLTPDGGPPEMATPAKFDLSEVKEEESRKEIKSKIEKPLEKLGNPEDDQVIYRGQLDMSYSGAIQMRQLLHMKVQEVYNKLDTDTGLAIVQPMKIFGDLNDFYKQH
jgi:hypothetical protein